MVIHEPAAAVLDPKQLPLPPRPKVLAIEPEPYEDTTGVDSLRAWVVLADDTRDEDLSGDNVIQLKSAIRERLRQNGIDLFAYFRLVTPSDDPRKDHAA